jgi:hypothetical protein
VGHGFVRASNGTLATFDVPGAVNGLIPPFRMNSEGAITGTYLDANVVLHGFLRTSQGTIITFDAPGAGTGFVQGTQALSINLAGGITGTVWDANGLGHGFVRSGNGAFATFDAPGAGTTSPGPSCLCVGTQAVDISPDGTVVGMVNSHNEATSFNDNHGFLRASDGTFTTFDPPGLINVLLFPFSIGPTDLYINPEGVVTGTYDELMPISVNPFGGNFRGFVRATDGTISTFDAANYPPCCLWTFPLGINPAGTVVGAFNDGFNVNHGFLRAIDGTITTFDVPGAGGTIPLGINPAGVIMGVSIDKNEVFHGFVLLPSAVVSASSQ